MKKFLFIVLLLVVLAVGGVVTMVVMSFNPTAYERDVVTYLKKLTGREVSVGGTTAITWNPIPTVTMTDVKISNIDKSQNPVMVSVEKVQVSIAWKSLLKSPLEIKQIELTRPILHLERLESNRANFTFPFLLDPNFQMQDVPLLTDGSTTMARLDTILIKDGTVTYSNQISGADLRIGNINGTLSADTVRGPYRFKGTGLMSGGQYALSANVGSFQGAVPVPVNFQLSEENSRVEAEVTGTLTPLNVEKWFDGAVRFNVGRLDTLLTSLGWPLPDLSAGATVSGSATAIIAPATDTLKDFILQVGEGENKAAFTGTLVRTVSGKKYTYRADVATDLFRLEQWTPYLQLLNWDWFAGEKVYPEITFKLTAGRVPYRGQDVRDLTVSGRYSNSLLSVEKSFATLPSGGKVLFSIDGRPKDQEAVLEFGVQAEVPSVQKLAQWLASGQKWAENQVLDQKGSFVGRIAWDSQKLSVTVDDLKIGNTFVRGSIQREELNKYEALLAIENVNIDNYTQWTTPEKPLSIVNIPQIVQKFLTGMPTLENADIYASIEVKDATLLSTPLKRLNFRGWVQNQNLKINRLQVYDWAASNLVARGTFKDIGGTQPRMSDFQISLESRQLPQFLQRVHLFSDLPLIQQASDAFIKVSLKKGKEGNIDLDTQADLSNATLKFKGELKIAETFQGLQDMTFEIRHPNFQTFMKLVEPSFDSLPKLDGTFKATGRVTGNPKHFEFTDTTLAIGLQQLNGSLTFDNGQIKTLTANVMSPALDLERFTNDVNPFYTEVNGLSKRALDLSALNNWNLNVNLNASQLIYKDINIRQADAQVTLQNKELNLVKLTGVSGASDKSPVQMKAKLDWNTTPTFTTVFDIKNIPLRADFMVLPDFAMGGGSLSVSGELKARGTTPADFIDNLNGQGQMMLRGGQMIGVDVEKMIPIITRAIQRSEGPKVIEPEFKRVLNSGKTVLQYISGDYVIADGVARMMDLTLETTNAVANPTQIVWDIPKRTLDISIPVLLKPLNSLPPFILGLSASVGGGSYKANYADLLAALSNRSQAVLANDMRQKQEAAQAASLQKRSERLAESKKLTTEARQAVAGMEQKIVAFPFEKGRRLLATAKDTLTLLNQLAVKEDPTDAQLIQQIEYARTVLLKADEFRQSLERETLFNAQNQMASYQQKAAQMTEQLQAWAKGYPDILVLAKLAENAAQNNQIITQSAAALTPNLPVAEADNLLAVCAEALDKIEKAYAHAARFDLSGVPNQVAGEAAPQKQQVKGSFKRSE